MSEAELKHCPFCGGDAILESLPTEDRITENLETGTFTVARNDHVFAVCAETLKEAAEFAGVNYSSHILAALE
jgi:hypothetical protein